jgi:hypothetical protein
MTPKFQFPSRADFGNSSQRMLIELNQQNFTRPFILEGHPDFIPGLFKFFGRKRSKVGKRGQPYKAKRLKLLQGLNTKKKRPGRVKWLSGALFGDAG